MAGAADDVGGPHKLSHDAYQGRAGVISPPRCRLWSDLRARSRLLVLLHMSHSAAFIAAPASRSAGVGVDDGEGVTLGDCTYGDDTGDDGGKGFVGGSGDGVFGESGGEGDGAGVGSGEGGGEGEGGGRPEAMAPASVRWLPLSGLSCPVTSSVAAVSSGTEPRAGLPGSREPLTGSTRGLPHILPVSPWM